MFVSHGAQHFLIKRNIVSHWKDLAKSISDESDAFWGPVKELFDISWNFLEKSDFSIQNGRVESKYKPKFIL